MSNNQYKFKIFWIFKKNSKIVCKIKLKNVFIYFFVHKCNGNSLHACTK